jgi:hypothetical protein
LPVANNWRGFPPGFQVAGEAALSSLFDDRVDGSGVEVGLQVLPEFLFNDSLLQGHHWGFGWELNLEGGHFEFGDGGFVGLFGVELELCFFPVGFVDLDGLRFLDEVGEFLEAIQGYYYLQFGATRLYFEAVTLLRVHWDVLEDVGGEGAILKHRKSDGVEGQFVGDGQPRDFFSHFLGPKQETGWEMLCLEDVTVNGCQFTFYYVLHLDVSFFETLETHGWKISIKSY